MVQVIEFMGLIIAVAIIMPVGLGILFNAPFTRPIDNVFYNISGNDSTMMSDDADNDYFEAVGQVGTLLNGKRINSVTVDMANTNDITNGDISIGIYSISGNSITQEKLFDVLPVTDIPTIRTSFQYNTDYIMDSNDAIVLLASGFNTEPDQFITVYLKFDNPIADTNMIGRQASDLTILNFASTDTVGVFIETEQIEDTDIVTLIGVLAVLALVILALFLLRGRLG